MVRSWPPVRAPLARSSQHLLASLVGALALLLGPEPALATATGPGYDDDRAERVECCTDATRRGLAGGEHTAAEWSAGRHVRDVASLWDADARWQLDRRWDGFGWGDTLSLGDLADGDSFTVLDSVTGKEITFGNFEAEAHGFAPGNFDFYRVLPLDGGFKILTPLFGLLGHDSGLSFSYDATAQAGAGIQGLGVSFFAGGIYAEPSVDLVARSDATVATLHVPGGNLFHGGEYGYAEIDPSAPALRVDEHIATHAHLFGKALAAGHRFDLVMLPEPEAAPLVAAGLVLLVTSGRGLKG